MTNKNIVATMGHADVLSYIENNINGLDIIFDIDGTLIDLEGVITPLGQMIADKDVSVSCATFGGWGVKDGLLYSASHGKSYPIRVGSVLQVLDLMKLGYVGDNASDQMRKDLPTNYLLVDDEIHISRQILVVA